MRPHLVRVLALPTLLLLHGCTLWVQAQNTTSEEQSAVSCAQQCGQTRDGCFCDTRCLQSGDCCDDFVVECGGSEDAASCSGRCGLQAPIGCFCTEDCARAGGADCCPDVVDFCPAVDVSDGGA